MYGIFFYTTVKNARIFYRCNNDNTINFYRKRDNISLSMIKTQNQDCRKRFRTISDEISHRDRQTYPIKN